MVERQKAKKRSSEKMVSKSKTMSKSSSEDTKLKAKGVIKSDFGVVTTYELRKHFFRERNTKIKEIKHLDHIKDYDIWTIKTHDDKMFFMVKDWDSVTQAAIADVEASWGDYEESGWVSEDTDVKEFVSGREEEILSSVDGAIHFASEVGDEGFYYWRYN